MNVFSLRNRLIDDYASFVSSYVRIRDPKIEEYVKHELEQGALWPDPLVQLNPSFVKGESIDELVTNGVLHPLCQRIFRIKTSTGDTGDPIRLYKHQADAVKLAVTGKSYVLTTGTGSGKVTPAQELTTKYRFGVAGCGQEPSACTVTRPHYSGRLRSLSWRIN